MSDPNQPSHDPNQPQPGYDPGQYPPPYSATSPGDPYGAYPPPGLPYDTTGYGASRRPPSTIVLGIIGILYALFLTVCTCVSLVTVAGSGAIMESMQQSGQITAEERAEFEAQAELGPWDIASALLSFAIGIICWVGAIGSLMGKEIGRKALVVFAALFIALMCLNIVIESVRGFPDVQRQMAAQGQQVPMGLLVAGVSACMLIILIYPICVLWFYTRPAIKAWFMRQDIPPQPAAPMYYGQ